LLGGQPASRPPAGSAVVTDKGLAGQSTEGFFAELGLRLLRPARTDEPDPGVFPNWLRQRIEAIIWTLKHQLGLDHPGGRIPAGLWRAWSSVCSPSTPRSGSTGKSAPRSSAP
jgi:hypothetical protein